MNLLPGNTAGEYVSFNTIILHKANIVYRYAPHDTDYLIKLMGGNVRSDSPRSEFIMQLINPYRRPHF